MAFDGGSGFDFWLPHVSAYDSEVASKAIEKVHTQPLKVMNGPLPCPTCHDVVLVCHSSTCRSLNLPSCAIGLHVAHLLSGLVHGDLRSHVILSPPSVVAGSNHVCESIAIAVNTAYEEHGDLPSLASVQLDNATPNHSMLVFGFCAQYVLFGIFDKFRVRFELASWPVRLVLALLHSNVVLCATR